MESYFSFSDPLSSGIDFYKTDEGALLILAESALSANSNLSASVTKIINIVSSPSSSISASSDSEKISFATVVVSGILDVSLVTAFERQDALVTISASTNVVINIEKFAFAASNIAILTAVSPSLTRIKFASSALQTSANASTNITKFAISDSQISVSSNTTVDVTKIIHIASAISGVLDVTLLAVFERQDGSVNISSQVIVSASMTKIAFGAIDQSVGATASNVTINITKFAISQSAPSASVNVANTVILKEAFALSSVSSSVNAVTNLKKIAFVRSVMSSTVTLTTAGKIFLATIRINVLSNTNIVVKPIRFSANVVSDNTIIRNLLLLDNKSLTNQTRTFAINATPKFIENENWQGNVSRYYKNTSALKGAKRTFNLDWSFIPNEASFTVDLRESRNFLKQIAQDSDVHNLTIINQDVNGVTPYTEDDIDVFITSYSETLIRRDLSSESYYFSCNMVLEEA